MVLVPTYQRVLIGLFDQADVILGSLFVYVVPFLAFKHQCHRTRRIEQRVRVAVAVINRKMPNRIAAQETDILRHSPVTHVPQHQHTGDM